MSSLSLAEIRDLLFPGLLGIRSFPLSHWESVFAPQFVKATPHIWIPKLSVPVAIAAGAAAAVINNPEVTRRFWRGWLQ